MAGRKPRMVPSVAGSKTEPGIANGEDEDLRGIRSVIWHHIVVHNHARPSATEAAAVFPEAHGIWLKSMAAGIHKDFGLRRAVAEADLTDTFNTECFRIGHAAPCRIRR